jgi:hypothetical protein
MDIKISPLTETDIPGAINVIQEAFQEDPYNLWVFNDRSKVIYNKLFPELSLSCFCFVPTSSQEKVPCVARLLLRNCREDLFCNGRDPQNSPKLIRYKS